MARLGISGRLVATIAVLVAHDAELVVLRPLTANRVAMDAVLQGISSGLLGEVDFADDLGGQRLGQDFQTSWSKTLRPQESAVVHLHSLQGVIRSSELGRRVA
jgi:hypothetical protein